ncbi:kinesin heavy chain [Spatholobus suberectus]|nr:kinesin heavy chain [Spatholobus suberectus]
MFFLSSTSSTLYSCFGVSQPAHNPPLSPNPNLTTYTYHTEYGTVSLTWSRSMLGRSLHVHLHNHSSFHLHLKPWKKKHGSKKLSHNTLFLWNLSNARFGSGPEPRSRFYLALVVDHNLNLLVGDLFPKLKAQKPSKAPQQLLVLKRDHVHVAPQRKRVYQTKTKLGGKVREIEIDCDSGNGYENDGFRLSFGVDGEKVLEVTRLKWKFRGSERVEVDGVHVQISWDVHDWLFEKDKDGRSNSGNGGNNEGHAVFMFKFEEDHEVRGKEVQSVWSSKQQWSFGCGEWGRNNGKSWSSSSLSVSSSAGSFGGSSSVMEWSSVEENDLVVPLGFSLVVYAWRR